MSLSQTEAMLSLFSASATRYFLCSARVMHNQHLWDMSKSSFPLWDLERGISMLSHFILLLIFFQICEPSDSSQNIAVQLVEDKWKVCSLSELLTCFIVFFKGFARKKIWWKCCCGGTIYKWAAAERLDKAGNRFKLQIWWCQPGHGSWDSWRIPNQARYCAALPDIIHVNWWI